MLNSKRIFDTFAALALGIIVLPITLGIVLAIKVTSPGPVLFRQKRLGLNGKVFLICLLYTSPSPRDQRGSRMPSSA